MRVSAWASGTIPLVSREQPLEVPEEAADSPIKLNIVHAVPSLNRGGGERLMIELANRQVRDGHKVTVVAGFWPPPERAHTGLDPDVKLIVIAPREASRLERYCALLPWFLRNRRWLAVQDLLHCHMTLGAALGTLLQLYASATGRRRPAVVETYHAIGMPISKLMRALHTRMLQRRHAVALMVDHPLRQKIAARQPNMPVWIIPAGVEAPRRSAEGSLQQLQVRDQFAIPDEVHLVGTIGRFVPERQPWIYVPVFARIAEAMGANVHFLMGGDGPELERVRREIILSGLEERVHLPGLISDLPSAFSAMDLFVTLNVGPVCGVAGLEAAAAGLPLIAYQVLHGYADGEKDVLWSSRSLDEVAEKAIELLRSADARDAMAKRQYDHVISRHSPGAMADHYYQLYREAMGSGRERSRGR